MITYGSYFVSDRRADSGLLIYGYVLTEQELRENEDEETMSALSFSYQRGFRFARCYSIACVEGEYGSVHDSMCIPITKEVFEQAQGREWNPTPPGTN